jgi:hypothetical protein
MSKQSTLYALITIYFLSSTNIALAQYLYLREDPRRAHAELIDDLLAGQPKVDNFTSRATAYLDSEQKQFVTINGSNPLGQLLKVCATLVIQDPTVKEFSFRSIHDGGKIDWVVYIEKTSGKIDYLAFMLSNKSGAPALLPPYIPKGAQVLTPPANFGCLDVASPQNAHPEIDDCKKWPVMCEK